MWRAWIAGALGAAVTVAASNAEALVTEPNGLVVPLDSMNGEQQLFQMFAARSEPIDWQNDAVTMPETFSPLCDFSAEFLLREAGGQSPLGWYNVVPGATVGPPANQIYEIVACNTAPGAMITSQTIRNDPNYAGGLIGFALANGSGCVSFNNPGSINQIHYTEPKFNVFFGGNPATPWFMNVVYDSKVEPNAFYLAFEDGNTNPITFNNDGDFNDFVVLLRGLVCAGGGGPCDTGTPGVCGPGIEVCRNGAVTCEGVVPAGTETCDGLDNDCNGEIDDGDLCPPDQICDQGTCVSRCGSGEFECPPGKVCRADGFCIDEACIDVTCPAGQICKAGSCVSPCDGVVCPFGQVCRAGACVNPCSGVTCPMGEVCFEGACRAQCDCAPCGQNLECETSSGLCVQPGCSGVVCPMGQHCETGTGCVDDCAAAVCPPGQTCTLGNCVDDPNADAGVGGSGGTGGTLFEGGLTGGTGAVGGTGASGGDGGGAGSSNSSGGSSGSRGTATEAEGGCGCRVAGADRSSLWLLLLTLPLALVGRRRPRG